MHQGILRREVRWQSPGGAILDLSFERFVSYADEHMAGLRVLATAVNKPCRLQLNTGLNSHVTNDYLVHWRMLGQGRAGVDTAWLHVSTRHTNLQVGAAVRLASSGDGSVGYRECPGQPHFSSDLRLEMGQTMQLDKLVFAKLIPMDELGVYAIAVNIVALPILAVRAVGAAGVHRRGG